MTRQQKRERKARRYNEAYREFIATAREEQVGQLIWTPGMIRDYMNQTDAFVNAFNTDMLQGREDGKVDGAVWSEWKTILANWRAFYNKNKDSWAASVTYTADEYRNRLRVWRKKLADLGGKVKSAELPPEDEPFDPSDFFKGAGTATVVILVGAAAAFYFWRLGK